MIGGSSGGVGGGGGGVGGLVGGSNLTDGVSERGGEDSDSCVLTSADRDGAVDSSLKLGVRSLALWKLTGKGDGCGN